MIVLSLFVFLMFITIAQNRPIYRVIAISDGNNDDDDDNDVNKTNPNAVWVSGEFRTYDNDVFLANVTRSRKERAIKFNLKGFGRVLKQSKSVKTVKTSTKNIRGMRRRGQTKTTTGTKQKVNGKNTANNGKPGRGNGKKTGNNGKPGRGNGKNARSKGKGKSGKSGKKGTKKDSNGNSLNPLIMGGGAAGAAGGVGGFMSKYGSSLLGGIGQITGSVLKNGAIALFTLGGQLIKFIVPIVAGVLGLIVTLVLSCCKGSCKRKKNRDGYEDMYVSKSRETTKYKF